VLIVCKRRLLAPLEQLGGALDAASIRPTPGRPDNREISGFALRPHKSVEGHLQVVEPSAMIVEVRCNAVTH
jgi:hypothetical protein